MVETCKAEMILVALACGRLPEMLHRASRQPFIVFGTMEGKALAGPIADFGDGTASALPVYFYESG